jgi:L-ascorbate metabolism protein UlaG (beta-lactamase superfamily)
MTAALRLTHIGTATLLIEIGELRLLTDPAFDPLGQHYNFGFGTGSDKLLGPAIASEKLGRIDAVLLSHDQHADNLDTAGRALLPGCGPILTTRGGAKRLGGQAQGLEAWESRELGTGANRIRVTATPARHGPPGSLPLAGPVIGFLLEWDGPQSPLYISGDTVYFRGTAEVARRYRTKVAILHIGGVAFPISGPIRYTFNGREAAQLAQELGAATVIPVHYDGWSHFHETREATERAFAEAGLTDRVRWLKPGVATEIG